MRVIYKEPGKAPEVRIIENTLQDLQKLVGGYIENVTIASDAAIICNEEGRLMGLPYNCEIFGINFVGPIQIVGVVGDHYTDISDGGVELFVGRYRDAKR